MRNIYDDVWKPFLSMLIWFILQDVVFLLEPQLVVFALWQ